MANDRGLLPKARRRLRGRQSLPHHGAPAGLLDATWGFIRYIYGGGSTIEPELFELLRVRLAWANRCVH